MESAFSITNLQNSSSVVASDKFYVPELSEENHDTFIEFESVNSILICLIFFIT
jgi:hypothetical protein